MTFTTSAERKAYATGAIDSARIAMLVAIDQLRSDNLVGAETARAVSFAIEEHARQVEKGGK